MGVSDLVAKFIPLSGRRPYVVQQIVSWRRIWASIVYWLWGNGGIDRPREEEELPSAVICSIYYWPIPRTYLRLIICERERIYKGSWLSLSIPIQIASTSELVSSNTHIIKVKKVFEIRHIPRSCEIMKLFTHLHHLCSPRNYHPMPSRVHSFQLPPVNHPFLLHWWHCLGRIMSKYRPKSLPQIFSCGFVRICHTAYIFTLTSRNCLS